MVDLSLDPEEIKQGGVAMFAASEGMHEDFKQVAGESAALADSVDTGSFSGVGEVVQAVERWEGAIVPGLRGRVEELGAFLAVYAVQHVDLDGMTAELFAQYADPEVFPVDPDSRTTPVPE
jgi:sigma54-dependent transcription regulator